MNESRFDTLMRSVDDGLLEEAEAPRKNKGAWKMIAYAAVAACVCIAAVSMLTHPKAPGGEQTANPVQEATEAQITELGYSLPLPDDAKNAAYSTIDSGAALPMAQVTFQSGGQKYTCRALKTESSKDISGISADWAQTLSWKAGTLEMQMNESDADNASWVGWYSADDGTQWCLSAQSADALSVLNTAQQIVDTLGYEMEVAPEGAKNVSYSAMLQDGLTVAETSFTLDGVKYAYRTASTSSVDDNFADISGDSGKYQVSAATQVGWCNARIYYNMDGSGKLVWFDVVPGLLYSLTMSDGASQSALLDMAQQLYTPAQGDVG